MRADQPLRIGTARLGRERRIIDDITTISWQGNTITRFRVGRARLGILTGKSADAYDWQLQSVDEYQAHLQHDLEPVRDQRRATVIEALRTIAALQQEAPPLRSLGEHLLQRVDLPRSD